MNRREAIRAALTLAKENGIDLRRPFTVIIFNESPTGDELTIGPAATKPFTQGLLGGPYSHDVTMRYPNPAALTVEP